MSMRPSSSQEVTQARTVTVTGSAAGFAQEISVGRHRLSADEPTSEGGTDSGPNPYDLRLRRRAFPSRPRSRPCSSEGGPRVRRRASRSSMLTSSAPPPPGCLGQLAQGDERTLHAPAREFASEDGQDDAQPAGRHAHLVDRLLVAYESLGEVLEYAPHPLFEQR